MTLRLVAAVALLALLVGGCGEQDEDATPRGPASAELRSQLDAATRVDPGDFAPAGGRTLRQVADAIEMAGPQLAFATQQITPGRAQRLAFGLIDPKTGFLYAPTVVYIARGENAPASGPFEAPADLLVTDPPFRSQTAATEEDPFAAIYEAQVEIPRPGRYLVLAVSKFQGKDVAATGAITVRSKQSDRIPDVGEPAPRVATDTVAAAGGDIKAIDTRLPPDDMHDDSLEDVVGKRPVALVFATPQLCASRVCGPVVDIALQLKETYGDRMTFIHQEVYVDNEVAKGLRPPLRAFNLQTEPWLFVIDRRGRITSRLEGSFGFNAFQAAIRSGLN
jgi:hypothetical protein